MRDEEYVTLKASLNEYDALVQAKQRTQDMLEWLKINQQVDSIKVRCEGKKPSHCKVPKIKGSTLQQNARGLLQAFYTHQLQEINDRLSNL